MNANELLPYTVHHPITEEHQDDFITDLFEDEGAFGEGDCAGL